MRNIIVISMFFLVTNVSLSWEIKLVKQISFNENVSAILVTGSFAVLEDGTLIFADIKDQNNQLKLFNEDGKLLKAWAKFGPGPEEFGGLASLDYQSPYLAVLDAGKQCVHVFEKLQNYEFKKIGQVPAWEASNLINIYDRYILIGGYIVSPRGQKYALFMRDFNGKETKYILPLENRFGTSSASDYKKIFEKVSGFQQNDWFCRWGNTVFYVSGVRLKIVKVDLRTKKIDFFGHAPNNFRPLEMDKQTKYNLMQPGMGKKVGEDLLTKFSFVGGIFADKDIVGVIYANREKKIGGELYFVPYLQIYDHFGKLCHEQKLAEVFSEETFFPLYYKKESRLLYLLSITSSPAAIIYKIYKFSINP